MSRENKVTIRPETLRAFPRWVQPTPDEIREVVRLAGVNRGLKRLTGVQVADLVGVASTGVGAGRGSRTVRSWVGQGRIPYAAWAILCAEAGFGLIWRPEGLEKDPNNSGAGDPEL
jgi:hypothetical protein